MIEIPPQIYELMQELSIPSNTSSGLTRALIGHVALMQQHCHPKGTFSTNSEINTMCYYKAITKNKPPERGHPTIIKNNGLLPHFPSPTHKRRPP